MSRLKRVVPVCILLLLLLISCCPQTMDNKGLNPSEIRPGPSSSLTAIDHAPIVIDENSDFVSQGWPGSGTAEAPYIIERLTINEPTQTCISIRSTDVHFIVRDCDLRSVNGEHGDFGWAGTSIRLIDVVNGDVINCTMRECGILLENSENCSIIGNTVFDCLDDFRETYNVRKPAINLAFSFHCIIDSNTIYNSRLGIHLYAAGIYGVPCYNQIFNNTIYGVDTGITVQHPLQQTHIEGNSVYGNYDYGITVGGWSITNMVYARDNSVVGNRIGWNTQNARDTCYYNIWANNSFSDYSGTGSYHIPGGWPRDDGGLMDDHSPSLWIYDGSPTIDHPEDISYEWNTRDPLITWNPSDELPMNYNVFLNGELLESGFWSNAGVDASPGMLYPGTYNLTLEVSNAAGRTTSDTVLIHVLPQNHNLVWGVEPEDSMTFTFWVEQHTDEDVIYDLEIGMNVTHLPRIRDYIEYIPLASYISYYFYESTLPELAEWFSDGVDIHGIITPAIPIGNWTLFSALVDEVYPVGYVGTAEVIDEAVRWGVSQTYAAGEALIETETTWFKDDGSLEHIYLTATNQEVGTVTFELDRADRTTPVLPPSTPTNTTPLEMPPTQLLVIGVSVAGGALVLSALFIVRHRKNQVQWSYSPRT